MAEPVHTSAAAGVGASAITLTGSVLGIHYDALVLAFVGGVLAMMHLPPMGNVNKFIAVASSSLFGGVLAPFATAAALNYWAWTSTVGDLNLRLAIAFTLGLLAQVLIPGALSLAKREVEAEGEK